MLWETWELYRALALQIHSPEVSEVSSTRIPHTHASLPPPPLNSRALSGWSHTRQCRLEDHGKQDAGVRWRLLAATFIRLRLPVQRC